MKKTLLALAVSLAAVNAHAYFDTGVDLVNKAGVNDGEMILTIWDTAAQKSYSQDLGVRYSALQNGSAFNGQVISLDSTALSIFGSSVDQTAVRWTLEAANSHVKNGTTNAYTGAGYVISVANGETPAESNASITSIWNKVNSYQVATGMNDSTIVGNQTVSGSIANGTDNPTGYQLFGDSVVRNYSNFLYGSGSMDLWNFKYNNASGTQTTFIDLGSVSLDFSAKTLTIGSAPTVPVPAAAWLMGSALVGLGGIARRRRSV